MCLKLSREEMIVTRTVHYRKSLLEELARKISFDGDIEIIAEPSGGTKVKGPLAKVHDLLNEAYCVTVVPR